MQTNWIRMVERTQGASHRGALEKGRSGMRFLVWEIYIYIYKCFEYHINEWLRLRTYHELLDVSQVANSTWEAPRLVLQKIATSAQHQSLWKYCLSQRIIILSAVATISSDFWFKKHPKSKLFPKSTVRENITRKTKINRSTQSNFSVRFKALEVPSHLVPSTFPWFDECRAYPATSPCLPFQSHGDQRKSPRRKRPLGSKPKMPGCPAGTAIVGRLWRRCL